MKSRSKAEAAPHLVACKPQNSASKLAFFLAVFWAGPDPKIFGIPVVDRSEIRCYPVSNRSTFLLLFVVDLKCFMFVMSITGTGTNRDDHIHMGTIVNGANGGFKGKAGSVIGSSWKSINYIKGLYKKRTKPATEAQLIQQEKFRTLMRFLLPINVFLKIGFGLKNTNKWTPINAAFQFNLDRAITGSYPDYSLDYSKVVIADGSLYGGGTVGVAYDAGDLTFSWSTGASDTFETFADDRVYVLAYHPGRDEFISAPAPGTRANGEVTFTVPDHLATGSVHTWMFLSNRTKTRVSKSVYLGEVQLI